MVSTAFLLQRPFQTLLYRTPPSPPSLFRAIHTSPPIPWSSLSSSPTIRAAIHHATHLFTLSHTPEPAASAHHLALSTFQSPHPLHTHHHRTPRTPPHFDQRPPPHQLSQYIHLCRLRAERRVPVQYLVGDWDFHHITLHVRAPVLIPRPETEELVQLVLTDEDLATKQCANVLDVGFGSGCIMLALLTARPGWRAWGVDPAQEAFDLCQHNVKLLSLEDRAIITRGTVSDLQLSCAMDVLVSNPPYIPRREMEALDREVRDHEDYRALCGGEDGMDVIGEVLVKAPRLVKKGGSVWLEVDTSHPTQLGGMHFEGVEFVKRVDDMYGRPRFVHFRVV